MRRRVVAVFAAGALVAGCGGESGTAQPVAERWDPCSIPQDAIVGTGLDPDYKDVGWGEGIVVDDWDLCTYQGPASESTYFLSVTSSDERTIGETRDNTSYSGGVDLRIGDRDAYRFYATATEPGRDCNIAVTSASGLVVFGADFKAGIEPTGDPCDVVLGHATDLQWVLPPAEK